MTLWLLTCYGRMRQNMLTFFHRIASHDLPWQSTSQWVFLIFWIFVSGYCLPLLWCPGTPCILYLLFPGHLGHLIWMLHPVWSPHLCLWRRRSCGYCAWDFPPPQQGKVDSSLTLFCLNYPGCAGHRKPALNTLLSNITKVYNLLSTIEMSGSWSPD